MVRLWDASTGQSLHSLQPLAGPTITETSEGSDENPQEGGYTGLLLCSQLSALAGVTYDHSIIFYNLKEPGKLKQVLIKNVLKPGDGVNTSYLLLDFVELLMFRLLKHRPFHHRQSK